MKFCLDCKKPKSSRKGNYCKKCGYKHRTRPRGLKYKIVSENKGWFRKGCRPWNKGVISKLRKDKPGYDAIHEWVERWKGKPKICDFCGSKKKGGGARRVCFTAIVRLMPQWLSDYLFAVYVSTPKREYGSNASGFPAFLTGPRKNGKYLKI